jgi:2-polyprenyl-3-methyl-5-hydroxy-6-metoxy-1,4-benzoquinol methylase
MSERYHAVMKNWIRDGAGRAHLVRYFFARGFVNKGEIVVDAGCGTGYGSKLLANVASEVHGYDYDLSSVEKARADRFPNTQFYHADLMKDDIVACDVVVALEVIEHLPHPEVAVKKFKKVARRAILFSVPLDEEPGANPFHLQTFNKGQIEQLMNDDEWMMFHSLMQGNHYLGILFKKP